MAVFTGNLQVVGSYYGDGNMGHVALLRVGTEVVQNAKIQSSLHDGLSSLVGQDVSVHVHRFLLVKPWVIGVRSDDGVVYAMTAGRALATALAYFLIMPLVLLVPGALIGFVLPASLANTMFAGIFAVSWLGAVNFILQYVRLRAS